MGWVVNATPRSLYPMKETRCPLYRRLGKPQGRTGQVRKISPPPGFDPWTVQAVASRNTECGIPAHIYFVIAIGYFLVRFSYWWTNARLSPSFIILRQKFKAVNP